MWLDGNNLESSSVIILESLSTLSTLKLLDINNNQVTEEAGKALACVILHNTGLEKLYLHDNHLGEGTFKVAKALQHITSLISLDLGNNNIPEEAFYELAIAIK